MPDIEVPEISVGDPVWVLVNRANHRLSYLSSLSLFGSYTWVKGRVALLLLREIGVSTPQSGCFYVPTNFLQESLRFGDRPEDPPTIVDRRIHPKNGDTLYLEFVNDGDGILPRWSSRTHENEGHSIGWYKCIAHDAYEDYPENTFFKVIFPPSTHRSGSWYVDFLTPEEQAERPGSYTFERPAEGLAAIPGFWCSFKAHKSSTPARHRAAVLGIPGQYGPSPGYRGHVRPMCDECWLDFASGIKTYHRDEKRRAELWGYHDNEPTNRGFFASPGEISPSRFYGIELEMTVEGDDDEGCTDLDEDGNECGDCRYCRSGPTESLSTHWYNNSGLHDRCQAATDSSISRGYEIISSPMTLREHVRYWSGDERKNALRAYGTDDTCGMHVHVNRSSLSDLTICKLQEFLSYEENQPLVTHCAGRRHNTYCEVPKKTSFVTLDNSRYCALNVSNTDTIEFRIFAGTRNPARILANIQFCDALIAYCEESALGSLDAFDFLHWLKKKVKASHRFRALNAHIAKGY